jgi:hypothetical protein
MWTETRGSSTKQKKITIRLIKVDEMSGGRNTHYIIYSSLFNDVYFC